MITSIGPEIVDWRSASHIQNGNIWPNRCTTKVNTGNWVNNPSHMLEATQTVLRLSTAVSNDQCLSFLIFEQSAKNFNTISFQSWPEPDW